MGLPQAPRIPQFSRMCPRKSSARSSKGYQKSALLKLTTLCRPTFSWHPRMRTTSSVKRSAPMGGTPFSEEWVKEDLFSYTRIGVGILELLTVAVLFVVGPLVYSERMRLAKQHPVRRLTVVTVIQKPPPSCPVFLQSVEAGALLSSPHVLTPPAQTRGRVRNAGLVLIHHAARSLTRLS